MLNLKLSLAIVISFVVFSCSSPQSSQEPNSSEETVKTATTDAKGTLKLVANGEDFVRQGFVTKDGWAVSFDNVWVNLAEVIAYQTDPPYNPDSDKAIASSVEIVLLEEEKIVDLAEGDADADPIHTSEVNAPTGMYNALAWKIVKATNGELQDQTILLKGKAEKDGNTIDFAISFDKELSYSCGEFVGDERKGIVKDSESAELETTFHFDHIFGDAEASPDDGINTGAIGFDPFASLAENGKLEVNSDTLKDNLDRETYQTLEEAIIGLGHVGEGHCQYQ